MPKMLALNPTPIIPLENGWALRATKACRGPKGLEFIVELLGAQGVIHDTHRVRKSDLQQLQTTMVARIHAHEHEGQ